MGLKSTHPPDSQEPPMLMVGQFLNILLKEHSIFSPDLMSMPRHHVSSTICNQPLYFCSSYSNANCLRFILEIFSKIPEAYQVLRCQTTTSEEELELFLKRALTQPNYYLLLDINKLPFKLQEVRGLSSPCMQ